MRKTKVLYIASQERSGSTLISQILGQTPGFFSVGELYIIWRYGLLENRLCGCGQSFQDCEFWQTVLSAAQIPPERATELHRASRAFIRRFPQALLPGGQAAALRPFADYGQTVERLYQAVADQTGASVIVDASKSIVHYFFLSQLPTIDLYMVHLVRDPHGVEYSILKRKHEGVPEYRHHNVAKSSLGWMLRNLLMEQVGQRNPEAYLRVNYESFVSQPSQVLAQVVEMLNEAPSQLPCSGISSVTQTEFEVSKNHVLAGSPKRFRRGNDSIKLDEAWKRQMAEFDRTQVSLLTWPLLYRYGYLASR